MNEIFIRRSIRKFLDKPVEKEKVERILKAAMQAPSAHNQQPWHFVVIDDPKALNKIRTMREGARPLQTAPLAIALVIDPVLKAPARVPQDMGAATQNLMLQAVTEDLGTCWIGTYPDIDTMNEVRELLDIPNDYEPYAVIACGYPDGEENQFVDRYQESRIKYNNWR